MNQSTNIDLCDNDDTKKGVTFRKWGNVRLMPSLTQVLPAARSQTSCNDFI